MCLCLTHRLCKPSSIPFQRSQLLGRSRKHTHPSSFQHDKKSEFQPWMSRIYDISPILKNNTTFLPMFVFWVFFTHQKHPTPRPLPPNFAPKVPPFQWMHPTSVQQSRPVRPHPTSLASDREDQLPPCRAWWCRMEEEVTWGKSNMLKDIEEIQVKVEDDVGEEQKRWVVSGISKMSSGFGWVSKELLYPFWKLLSGVFHIYMNRFPKFPRVWMARQLKHVSHAYKHVAHSKGCANHL